MSAEPKAVKRKLSKLDDPVEVYHRRSSPHSSLCTRCLELRLEEALGDIEPKRGLNVKIADVGQYYRQQSDYGCNLCHILSASRVTVDQPVEKPQGDEDEDELHVYNLCDHLSWIGPSSLRNELLSGSSSLYLAVVPSSFTRNDKILTRHGERNGFIVIRRRGTTQPRIYAPQIVSPRFDLSLARYWLQYCKDHHKRLCSLKNKATTELHLIDCRSLEVIPAPDRADYTALSYVWGVPTTETNSSESIVVSGSDGIPLPSSVPAVITDAICVTIGLGFHYLWVDRYCINQDSHSKHQQINQMDSIYQNAELTIVAAAGNGPEYGLPGINSRSRCGQHRSTIGDFDIIPTLRHPHSTIQSSRWSTRGWTFQESAISRRNLVFTDDQAYFECNAMNCHESLSSDLDKLHIKNKSKFREILQVGLFGRTEKQKYGHFDESNIKPAYNLVRFMGMVEQYTARNLTYDTDSLNAFTGIIRKFTTNQTALGQIWGVPFCRDARKGQISDSFLDGLGWNHKASVSDARGHPRRRPEFPSWSWAGWAGEIQYEERSSFGAPRQLDSEVESVSIEIDGGLKVDLSAYIDKDKVALQETIIPPAIHVQALALPTSAFSHDTSTTPTRLQIFQYPAKLALSTGPWDASHFYQSLLNADQRRCIYLGHLLDVVVIMVLEAQDDSWSRVGLIFLDGLWFWNFHQSWRGFEKSPSASSSVYRKIIEEETLSFRII